MADLRPPDLTDDDHAFLAAMGVRWENSRVDGMVRSIRHEIVSQIERNQDVGPRPGEILNKARKRKKP